MIEIGIMPFVKTSFEKNNSNSIDEEKFFDLMAEFFADDIEKNTSLASHQDNKTKNDYVFNDLTNLINQLEEHLVEDESLISLTELEQLGLLLTNLTNKKEERINKLLKVAPNSEQLVAQIKKQIAELAIEINTILRNTKEILEQNIMQYTQVQNNEQEKGSDFFYYEDSDRINQELKVLKGMSHSEIKFRKTTFGKSVSLTPEEAIESLGNKLNRLKQLLQMLGSEKNLPAQKDSAQINIDMNDRFSREVILQQTTFDKLMKPNFEIPIETQGSNIFANPNRLRLLIQKGLEEGQGNINKDGDNVVTKGEGKQVAHDQPLTKNVLSENSYNQSNVTRLVSDYHENVQKDMQMNEPRIYVTSMERTINSEPIYTPKMNEFFQNQELYNKINEQIIKQAKLSLSKDKSEISFQLEPKELGRLTLKINMEQGIVTAKFAAANFLVKNLIEANLNHLRQSLEDLGIRDGKLEVGVGQQFLGENSNRQSFFKQGINKSKLFSFNDAYSEGELAVGNKSLLRQYSSFEYVV